MTVLSREANARRLVLLEAEGIEVTVSAAETDGRRVIVLESANPETSTALGLALLSWLGRTSWDKTGGFDVPGKKKRRKRR